MSNSRLWPTPEISAMRRPPLIAPTGELPLSTLKGQSSTTASNVRLQLIVLKKPPVVRNVRYPEDIDRRE
jgi:hypothetical protein